MSTAQRQHGVAAGLVVVALLLLVLGFLAVQFLSRLTSVNRASDQATAKLATLAGSIEQFVTMSGRLPCPANPALPTTDPAWGDEAVPTPTNDGTCPFPAGTIPWKTIGARQEDALDSWGWKVSYRVFSGTAGVAGSLTQPNGASMVECDTFEPTAGAATPVVGVTGGLCVTNADPTLRTTREPMFLQGKGLSLTELGTAKTDVAFVLISHGPSGLGAYTIAGQRNTLPAAGQELNNLNATGPFTIMAFSAAGIDPAAAGHFDDRLFYRTIPDLMRRTQLAARNWPDVPAGSTAVAFDRPTLEATSLGSGFTTGSGGSVGQVTVNFVGVVATGIENSAASNISFGDAGGYAGIGIAGGGSALIQSSANELLVLEFADTDNTKFAATLGDFGTYSGTFSETVAFFFFQGGITGTNVATFGGLGCNIDGGLASFSMDVGVAYDTVAIQSIPAFDSATATFSGISAFLVNAVASCPSTATTCVTSLTDFGNTCAVF